MDGRLFLAIVTPMCVAVFFNGLRFARMRANPFVGRTVPGFPIEGGEVSVASLRRLGRIQMISAPLFLALFAAMCFGLFGPVEGITVIGEARP